jgi:hypothetical protein
MTVSVGISEIEKIIGTFETECIPNVGELIFDQINRKHLVVEKRVFGIFNGQYIKEMDITLWCKEI